MLPSLLTTLCSAHGLSFPPSLPTFPPQVYALGGYNISDNYNTNALGEVLDPATGQWSYIADMTISRGDLQARGSRA